MLRQGDVGPKILDDICKQMQIDSEWSVREERSITWWGHGLGQRIWAEPVRLDGGYDIVRVHAETDVLRNVPDDTRTAKAVNAFNLFVSLSGFVWDQKAKKVGLRCSAYFHAQNLDWLSPLFLCAAAIQVAEAEIQVEAFAKLVGGESDISAHPVNGSRSEPDDMLNIIAGAFAPRGRQPSAFTSEEFRSAMKLNPQPWVIANAGDDGLTVEFSFPGCMPPTALLTMDNKTSRPRLGSGLLLLLRLPSSFRGIDVESLATQLNLAELTQSTHSHFMGAWCVDISGNRDLSEQGLMLTGVSMPVNVIKQQASENLTYCSFLPSGVYRPNILGNVIYSMAHRAQWANEYLASLEGVSDLFGPCDVKAVEKQTEEHASLLARVFNRVGREQQKKN